MPRQNTMAFAPVKLILLAVLLVQVASAYNLPGDKYAGGFRPPPRNPGGRLDASLGGGLGRGLDGGLRRSRRGFANGKVE